MEYQQQPQQQSLLEDLKNSCPSESAAILQLSRCLSKNTRKIYEFVAFYDAAARAKVNQLNQKLSYLERQMESLEGQMSTVVDSSQQF